MAFDILDFLLSQAGINLLLIAFIPGFIFISLMRHWFNKLETLQEIETIFWSVPLSLAINILLFLTITFIYGNFPVPTDMTPETLFSRLGLYDSILVFSIIYLVYFPNKYWKKGRTKKEKLNVKLSQWFYIVTVILIFLSTMPQGLGAPKLPANPLDSSFSDVLIMIKIFSISTVSALLLTSYKKMLPKR